MFMSVVFPAPFSPSSACTSPGMSVKFTSSFATTPGNLFTIPIISTSGCFSFVSSTNWPSCCPYFNITFLLCLFA